MTTWIWIAAIIGVAAIAYFYWTGGNLTPATLVQTASPVDALNAKTSAQSSLLNSLKIDSSFFKDSVYTSLQDYSIQVPSQDVGRANPFAPLDGEATSTDKTGAASGPTPGPGTVR